MFKVGDRVTVLETMEDHDGWLELSIGDVVTILEVVQHDFGVEYLVSNGKEQFGALASQLGKLNNEKDKEKFIENINKEIDFNRAQVDFFMADIAHLMGLEMSVRGGNND